MIGITDINNKHFDSEQNDDCIDYIEDVFFWGNLNHTYIIYVNIL